MEVLNYTDFRKNLAKSLDRLNDDAEIMIVSHSEGKNVVMMDEYNSIAETLYLVKSEANHIRLQNVIDEMNRGKHFSYDLIEE